jgi:ferredoxin-NADP reductase
VKVKVKGTVTKVSSLARGGVSITFTAPPMQQAEAYKAGQWVEKPMLLELSEVKTDGE